MPHATKRTTTRSWKFTLRCPTASVDAVCGFITTNARDYIKIRKNSDDLKSSLEAFDVTFVPQPDEGGLSVLFGDIRIVHRTSIDYFTFPKMRAAIASALGLDKTALHLEEHKRVKSDKETKVAIAEPTPIAEPIPAPQTLTELMVPPKKTVAIETPDIPVMEVLQVPIDPPPPTPKAVKKVLNQAARVNLAEVHVVKKPDPDPVPVVAPTPAVVQRRYGYTPAPATTPAPTPVTAPTIKRFGFGK